MRSIFMRAMTIAALCASLVACDDIILPPDDGGGGGGGGGDTVNTTGIITGIVVQDSSSPYTSLESARVALMWRRPDGTLRVGSITKINSDMRFTFRDLAALTSQDLLSDPSSSKDDYGIASIMLITKPETKVGDVLDFRVILPAELMYVCPTHDVIYRVRSGAADDGTPWLSAFRAGFTLGMKSDIAIYEYMPDPSGIAVLPVFGM